MVQKRNLSKKRTDRQTISISPFLKDWVNKYVEAQQKENPDKKEFKSVSRFISDILQSSLELLEQGKTINDLKKTPDNEIESFYDKITFQAVIPLYENNIELSRYVIYEPNKIIGTYLKYLEFALKSDFKLTNERFSKVMKRFTAFTASNKVTKTLKVETRKDKFIVNYEGYYENIHFELSKALAGLYGVLGLKLTNMIYTKNYTKLEFEKTYIFSKNDLLPNERSQLYLENTKFFTNYYRTILDKKYHLWMRLSKFSSTVITFKNYDEGFLIVKEMIEESIKFNEGNIKEIILILFEKLNWIRIEENPSENYFFSLKLNRDHFEIENKILFNTLNNYGRIEEKIENKIIYS